MFLDELHAYVPFDDRERGFLARITAHVAGGGDLFSRKRFDGHLTGSAFILNHSRTHLLLLEHKKLGRWLQPGGHGEAGETHPLAVARREALEETGLHDLRLHSPAIFDLDVHTIPARGDEAAHEHLDVRYLFVAADGAAPRIDPNESKQLRWLAIAECRVLEASFARVAQRLLLQ